MISGVGGWLACGSTPAALHRSRLGSASGGARRLWLSRPQTAVADTQIPQAAQ